MFISLQRVRDDVPVGALLDRPVGLPHPALDGRFRYERPGPLHHSLHGGELRDSYRVDLHRGGVQETVGHQQTLPI